MSVEENKAIVRRYFEGDRDGRDNIAIWDEICHPDMVLYISMMGPILGLEAIKQFSSAVHSAFSDFGIMVEDMVAEGDKVVARWTLRGNHSAPFAMPSGTIPPTGKRIAVTGISICELRDGKIVQEIVEGDWLGMMQQLGVIAAPGQAES